MLKVWADPVQRERRIAAKLAFGAAMPPRITPDFCCRNHEMSYHNTYVDNRGKIQCVMCRRIYRKRYYYKKQLKRLQAKEKVKIRDVEFAVIHAALEKSDAGLREASTFISNMPYRMPQSLNEKIIALRYKLDGLIATIKQAEGK